MRTLVTTFLALSVATGAQVQQSRDRSVEPIGTASIGGVVVTDEGPDHVVRRATVQLSGPGLRAQRTVISDESGRFVFDGLAAARYTIAVSKPGYVRSYAGARRPWRGPGLSIDVSAGEQRMDLRVVLQRGSVIAGRVTDEQGQPVQGVRMQVMERRTFNGQLQVTRASASLSQPSTDDHGRFRLWGLPPGTYLVSAAPSPTMQNARLVTQNEFEWAASLIQAGGGLGATASSGGGAAVAGPERGPTVSYAPVYYPGTADPASASIVTLDAGEERQGVDIALRLVATARVRGSVVLPDGVPPINISLRMLPVNAIRGDELSASTFNLRTSVRPQGQFEFPAVGPGLYVLIAQASSASPAPQTPGPEGRPPAPVQGVQDLWAEADVAVEGRDVENVALVFQRGMTVAGRVVFDGAAPAPETMRLNVYLSSSGVGRPGMESAVSRPVVDGAFALIGMAPGRYVFGTAGPGPVSGGVRWLARSAMWNGRDLLDEPIDIRPGEDVGHIVVTYTDRQAELTGTILDANEKPAAGYFVMLFSVNPAHWRVNSRRVRFPSQPQAGGQFRFPDLPPGEYYLAALTDFDPQDVGDPAFLEQVAQVSIRITIGEGEKKTQDIKIAGGMGSGLES